MFYIKLIKELWRGENLFLNLKNFKFLFIKGLENIWIFLWKLNILFLFTNTDQFYISKLFSIKKYNIQNIKLNFSVWRKTEPHPLRIFNFSQVIKTNLIKRWLYLLNKI